MDRLEVRALLSSGTPELAPLVFVEQGITVDNFLDEETFLKTLEETLQQHVTSLNQQFLVLSAAQVDRLAFRLHDALVPKRDGETRIVQAWTIQPQLQPKVKASAHLQVLKLSTILREVQRLRLHQSQTETIEAQNPIEVEIFSSLRFLEALKTEARRLKNVHYFSSQLRDLHIEHTEVTTLRDLLAPNPDKCKPWRKLSKLQMNCCELQLVDESLNLLKAVRTLDLGWNKIEKVETEVALKSLQVLNLCHNKLHSVPRMQSLRALRELDLAVNQISSLKGLETLTALERLDVSHNLIRSISEVELLTRLPRLTFLKMEFNPIARRPDYRREVLFYLGEPIELDGKRWNDAEVSSMKYRRMLMMSEERSSESPIWKQSAEVFGYPKASCRVDFPSKSPALVLGYPSLPQAKCIPAHYVEIKNPQSTCLSKSGNLGVAIGSRSEEENRRSRSFLKGRGMHDYQKPPQTVDDYFENQRHFIVTTTSRQRTKSYDLSTTRDREDSHGFDTNTIAQLNQEHSLSDFMCDFKEEELVMSECNVPYSDDAFATSPTQVSSSLKPGHNVNVRILLSEKEATRLDLHFEVDGIPANVEIKSQVLIESVSFSDGTESRIIYRWLRDVVAVGTLMHSSRQTILIKLQVRGSSEVMDAAYQFDTMTSLEALLSLLVIRLYKQYKGRIVIMNCAHCGALSLLTPKYPARADDALSIYSCLLCSSCNLRETSYKMLQAICSDEGVTIPSSIPLAPPPQETTIGGFYIEEAIAKDSCSNFGMCECVMISCYGIREVAALTSEQGADNEVSNDELNDAIVHAMTST